MKHTECEDCGLREGDCGYHFKMDGKTNYDIASLSACDKYGNCMFFKAKAKPQGDLISREALKAYTRKVICGNNPTNSLIIRLFDEIIDNTPSVELTKPLSYAMGFCDGLKAQTYEKPPMFERPQGEWIQREELFDDEGTSRLVWGCKNCGFSLKSIHDKRNYCPNCGADMRKGGGENEN